MGERKRIGSPEVLIFTTPWVVSMEFAVYPSGAAAANSLRAWASIVSYEP